MGMGHNSRDIKSHCLPLVIKPSKYSRHRGQEKENTHERFCKEDNEKSYEININKKSRNYCILGMGKVGSDVIISKNKNLIISKNKKNIFCYYQQIPDLIS